jgi:Reverse transcriptase (RNA-dependent DNA polymerase)
LLLKLKKLFNFSSFACNLLKSYLGNRFQRVKVNGILSDLAPVTSGTPQGGVISSLLFSLFINDISSVLDLFHLFADDLQIYCSSPGSNPFLCVVKMNQLLRAVSDWSVTNGVSINPEKSKVMLISRVALASPPPVFVDGCVVEYCSSAKVLGLTMTSDLNFDRHVSELCRNIGWSLSMLRQTRLVVSRNLRLRLVKALLLPKITYCCNIFAGVSRGSWSKLTISFNGCIRYAYGLSRFQSVSFLVHEFLGCSLEKFVLFRLCFFLFHLLRSKSPLYLYNQIVLPKHQRNGLLVYPGRFKTRQYECSFFIFGVRWWNSLSSSLRTTNSADVFRKDCVSYLDLERT